MVDEVGNEGLPEDVTDNPSVEIPVSADESGESVSTPEVSEVEQEARKYGWKPKEQWHKDPNLWRDAATFVDARNHVLPLVRKENQSLRAQLDEMKAELAQIRQLEQERSQQREQLTSDTLAVEMRQAAEEGNWDRFNDLNRKLIDGVASRKAAPPTQPQDQNAQALRMFNEFLDENHLSDNDEAKELILERVDTMRRLGSSLYGRDILEKARQRVVREYPHLFPAPRRQMAESGGFTGASRSRSLSWNDLKPEVREAWEKHILPEKGMTRQGLLEQAAENPSMYFQGR